MREFLVDKYLLKTIAYYFASYDIDYMDINFPK